MLQYKKISILVQLKRKPKRNFKKSNLKEADRQKFKLNSKRYSKVYLKYVHTYINLYRVRCFIKEIPIKYLILKFFVAV